MLILEIVLTLGVSAAVIGVVVTNVKESANDYVSDVSSDYQSLEEGYVSVFKAITIQVSEKIEADPTFDEMNAWLQSKDVLFGDAVGSDIYDGFAMTYKGGYAHSWDYGDYSDYDPNTRIWYQEAQRANGKITMVAPYVTYLGPQYPNSDKYIEMTVAQRYSSDISFDLDLKIYDIDELLTDRASPYPGTKALLFDENGFILSATDRSLYCHNINNPDEVLSADTSNQLANLRDQPNTLRLTSVDGTLCTVYATRDAAGNTYCVLFPLWELILRNFLLIGLFVLLLILIEVAIYLRSMRTFREMSLREHWISEIARAAFQTRLYVDLGTMSCTFDEASRDTLPADDYRTLYRRALDSLESTAERHDFETLCSPEQLAKSELGMLVGSRFSFPPSRESGAQERRIMELNRFVMMLGQNRTAFILANDVTAEERDQQQIMQSIAHHYATVFVGSLANRKIECIKTDAYFSSVSAHDQSFEKLLRAFADAYLDDAYAREFLDALSFETIAQKLEKSENYSLNIMLNDGHWYMARVIRGKGFDETHRFIILIENVDQQMARQKALEHALREARQASRAKSDFLSRMSHDIRTPMNGIIGMTHIAHAQNNPPETEECLDKIDTSSQFLLGLVNDILDISKVESGAVTLNPEPYRSEEFFDYLDAVIRPLCAQKGIHFEVETEIVDESLPTLDELRANQIAFNLLSNAVKFTPEGGTVRFVLKERMVDAFRMDMTVIVSDTGIGMSDEFLEHLFEPFAQETDHMSASEQGTGLGLSIVKRMTDLMGGTISVESAPGRGTTFTLHGIVTCVPKTDVEAPEKSDISGISAILEGKRVLLVEDHPLNTEIATALLKDARMLVATAEDGQCAVKAFEESPVGYYDVVLMDIRMPVMDGYTASRTIRALDRADARHVPIIAMTADAYNDDVANTRAAGMDPTSRSQSSPNGSTG